MRRVALTIIGLGLAMLAFTAQPRECLAGYCPSYPCFGPCGLGCLCMAPPGDYDGGTCYSAQAVPQLERNGWSQLR